MSAFDLTSQTIADLNFGTDSTFEVLTWNIEHFPKNGNTTLNYVSDIIEALDVDLIAIQEVEDISSFNQLVADLNGYEGYLESSYFAGLAYIYKTGSIVINDIYEIYTTSQYWSPFPRSPMVMELSFNNENFIVINNHFKCCGDGELDHGDSNDEEKRRYIASNLLKDYIDTNFPNKRVIVLGDLNDILTDSESNNVFQSIIDDNTNYKFADMDIGLGNSSNWSYPSWPSHLDHILITNELFVELEKDESEIQTIKIDDYISGGWSTYDSNISDHRPVGLKISPNITTDITQIKKLELKLSSFPNPFDNSVNISTNLDDENSEIIIYNVNGEKIVSFKLQHGENTVIWNAGLYPNGMYFAKLISKNNVLANTKLLLIK